ncbi:hypothetical protein JCM3765_000154 [Sporobolomyces pararoseus]
MNTLSYFLSTLRPTPPPSPRASTSELPLESSLVTVTPNRLPREHSSLDPTDLSAADVLDTDGEGSAKDGEGGMTRQEGKIGGESTESENVLLEAVLPPRIGIVPPSRKGSRKGKSRAQDTDSRFQSLDGGDPDEKFQKAEEQTLPFHGKQTTTTTTTTTVTISSNDTSSPSSWPFVARLARTWPFRFTASLYLLIRRFLSLFGLSHPPRPQYNSLLSPLSSEPDPEKSAVAVRSTIVSLSLRPRSTTLATPPSSVPPSPGSTTSSPFSQSIPRPIRAPPRLTPKTLVLDLDETLIHSTSRPTSGGRGRRAVPKGLKTTMVEVVLDGRSTMYTVYKRPWVDFFLRKVSSWYTVIIFTASLPEYADPVIDWLDGGDGRGGLIGGRLFRSHCLAKNGTYMKDLTVVDQDLAKVCLVDNSPVSYAINQANGIPIEGWINDPNDECLLDLLPMLDSLRFTNDVRRVLGLRGFGRSSSSQPLPTSNSGLKRNPANLSMTPTTTRERTGTTTERGGTVEARRKVATSG